jgi:DNA repair metallo-beta-lactamase
VVPEVGAGGGGGDLHQSPVMELCDGSCISEMEELCKQIVQEPNDLRKLLSRLEAARTSRDHKMSLDGLDLGAEEEITLSEFVKRLLAMDKTIPTTRSEYVPFSPCAADGRLQDTIHFPFSRHSSYNELCNLVAAFKPVDIYPCTVEEQTWTEDVSMRVLFGHLCAGTVFSHDKQMRLLFQENLEEEAPSRKRQKRSNIDSSPTSGSTENTSQEDNIFAGLDTQIQNQAANANCPRDDYGILEEEPPSQCQSMTPNVAAVRAAYKSHMVRAAVDDSSSPLLDANTVERERGTPLILEHVSSSQISISPSAFDSQPRESHTNAAQQLDGAQDENLSRSVQDDILSASNLYDQRSRRNVRGQAYRAAKLALQTNDSGDWDDLGIRSVGQRGHSELEEEL